MTCECGLSYVPGLEEDEQLHAEIHAEYMLGPQLSGLALLTPIAEMDGLAVYSVDGRIPIEIRRSLAHVAMVAHRSMAEFPSGYDGAVTEEDQRLHLLADEDRAIAMVVTSLDRYFWKLGWTGVGRARLISKAQEDRLSPKVARVWVARAYRDRALGRRLVERVCELLKIKSNEVGWEIPLTPAGTTLVRRLAPEIWWGAGDAFALEGVLEDAHYDI